MAGISDHWRYAADKKQDAESRWGVVTLITMVARVQLADRESGGETDKCRQARIKADISRQLPLLELAVGPVLKLLHPPIAGATSHFDTLMQHRHLT